MCSQGEGCKVNTGLRGLAGRAFVICLLAPQEADSAPTLRAGEPGETGASTGARMFSLLVGFWQLLFRRAEFHVLILGVDAAGKTTVLEQIKVRP